MQMESSPNSARSTPSTNSVKIEDDPIENRGSPCTEYLRGQSFVQKVQRVLELDLRRFFGPVDQWQMQERLFTSFVGLSC